MSGLATIAAGAALLTSGCAAEQDQASRDRDAVTAVLGELRSAQDGGDAETACREVYVVQEPGGGEGSAAADAEAEAEAEGGDGIGQCEASFRAAAARRRQEISDLSTEVDSVEVDGDQATAIVHTELRRADGSRLSQDVPYDLVRTPEGWRIRIASEG